MTASSLLSSLATLLLCVLLSLSLVPLAQADVQYRQALTTGVPFRPSFAQRLLKGNTAVFTIALPESELSSLQVTVSPLSAEAPGLYADFSPDATADTAQWNQAAYPVSRAAGDVPSLTVAGSDVSGQSTLYATVECNVQVEAACVFTIQAVQDQRQRVWPGQLSFDKVPAGQTMYYDFAPVFYDDTHYPTGTNASINVSRDDIHITATTLRGRISVFVLSAFLNGSSVLPTPANAQWRQVDYNNEVILIPAATTGQAALRRVSTQTFIIAVRADDASATEDNSVVFGLQVSYRSLVVANNFVPQAAIEASCRYLSDDVPTPGQSLVIEDWDQYCFYVPTASCPFDVSLTSLSGEQDVYMWWGGYFQSFQAGIESDNVRLTAPEPRFYAVIIYTPNNTAAGNVYTPGRYNVLYHSNCSYVMHELAVPNTQPQQQIASPERSISMAAFATQFEEFRKAHAAEAQAMKAQRSGDVALGSEPQLQTARVNRAKPLPQLQAAEPVRDAAAAVHVSASHSMRKVLSLTADSGLVDSSYHAIQLTQGQPQYASMPSTQIMRFVYQPLRLDDDLTFELRRRSGSDPNLYVSTSQFGLPFPTDCQWFANFSGDDYLTVDRMDEQACKERGCYYHIAVLVDGERATGFTVTASEGEALTDLQAGLEYANRLKPNEPDYLRFIVQQPGQDITMTLTDTGRTQPRLYVSTKFRLPDATNANWTMAVGEGGNDVTGQLIIRYSQVQNRACQPTRYVVCTYYIGVVASAATSYSIVVRTDGPVELTKDRATESRITNNQLQYFKYVVSPGYVRFAVSLYLISGLANMYVSNSEAPPVPSNASSYRVMRQYNQLNTPITIYEDSDWACHDSSGTAGYCTYTVAVLGQSAGQSAACYFSLTPSEGLIATVGVRNGQPIPQVIPRNTTYYWHLKLQEKGARFQVCVTVMSGDVTGYWTSRADTPYPDASNHELEWAMRVPGYGCIYNPNQEVGERYFSLTNPSTRFTASVSVMFLTQLGDNDTSSEVQLSDGVPQAMMLHGRVQETVNEQTVVYPANPLLYFNFILSNQVPVLTFDLYAVVNDADLYLQYANNNNLQRIAYPTRTNYFLHSASAGSDIIPVMPAPSGRYLGAAFHTTANTNPAVFIITASTGRVPQQLQAGLAVVGFVSPNLYKIFSLTLYEQQAVDITLTPTNGNPDLYAGLDVNVNATTAVWHSASLGVDVISIPASDPLRPTTTPWTLYVAVHANAVSSDFNIAVSLSGGGGGGSSSSFLQPGVATPGLLQGGEYHYYQFRPNSLNGAIDFTIQRLSSGSPALLVSYSNPQPSITNFTWQAQAYASNLYWRLNNPNNPRGSCSQRNVTNLEDCVYYIAVYATPYTADPAANVLSYTIMVAQPGDLVELRQGFPQSGRVAFNSTARYHFVNSNHDSTVIFAATASAGEVDLYAGRTPNVGPSNYSWSSSLTGDDVLAIRDASTTLYYYLAVHNSWEAAAQYSVLGKAYTSGIIGSGSIWLLPDQTQNDFCAGDDYTYYTILIDEGWTTMTVSVSARVGDPDLYINGPSDDVWPQWPTHRWGAWQQGADTIRILPDEGQESLPAGRYFISVFAADGMDLFYSISVSGEGRTQSLYSGETYTNELQAHHSMQYVFQVTTLAYDQLIFSLTSRTGDTDMYVSDLYRAPNSTHYNWTSRESGSAVDTVVLRATPDPRTGRQQLHAGWYYVSVVNNADSSSAAYALTATYGTKTALVDGQETTSRVRSGAQVLFDALYPAGQKFTITVVQLPSDSQQEADPVQLYVSLSADTIIPNLPATYQWESRSNGSTHTLEVDGEQCALDACRYYILVFMPVTARAAHDSDFSIITTTAASILTLTPGMAVNGQVAAGAYHVYKFMLSCAGSVSVLLTAFSGNPDLFMNLGPAPPTRTSWLWRSDNAGAQNDFISISPNSAQFRSGNYSMIGTYFVSVFGANTLTSDYTLLLTVDSQCGGEEGGNSSRPSVLNDGIPQFGRVTLRGWAYYSFTVAPRQWPTGVTIALSPLDGSDPDMFVTKDGSVPDQQHFAWDAQASAGDDDVLYISANATNPTACVPLESSCTYIIGVYGYTASLYTITASTNAAVLGLQLDYSKDGGVGPSSWRYYVVRVEDSSQPLVVIVSPTAGNPDLYVELERLPTADSPTSKTFGVDVVTIPQPTPGRYFIGVYGNAATVSLFSIVASQRGIDLRNGRPQDDALGMNERRYYYFMFNEPQGNRAFRLQIDAISFNPQLDVYVRRDETPAPNNYNFMLSSASGNALHLVVPRNHSQWRRTATWRVMVISRSDNAVFAITASQGTPPIYLSDGRPTDVAEAVPAGEYRYFRTLVLSNAYAVTVSVNLHYGAAALFVSTTEPLPGLDTSFTWSNTSRGVGAVNIVVPRTALPGYVYAGVRSDNLTSASYTVVISTGLVVMQAGQLQSASCQQQSLTNSFVINLPFNSSFTDDVTLSIQPANAAAANYSRPMLLYVTTNSSLARPLPGNNDWSFMILDWAHPFTISRNDVKLQACVARGNCELRIVVGCTGFTQQVDYQFSVIVGASFVPVVLGQVATGSGLTAGQDRYYTIDLGDRATAGFFQLRVEPCVGNVALYVNYLRGGVPTSGNNDASSTFPRSAQLVTVTTPITTGKVMATVRGTTSTPAQYRLTSTSGWDWDYISPSVTNNSNFIWVAAPNSVPDRNIKIWFLTARAPQAVLDNAVERPSGTTGVLKYTVYWQTEPNMEAVMFTQCGLARTTVATTYTSSSTQQVNATVTFRVPSDVNRYSINVLAQYVWRRGSGTSAVDTPATDGYLVYRYLSAVLPGQGITPTGSSYPDDSDSSSSGRWYPPHPADNSASSSEPVLSRVVLAFAIGVPLFVLVCAIIVFLHMKHQHIHDTGGVELNEAFTGSSSSGRAADKYGHLVEEEPDTGGYVPPGAQFTRTAAGLSQQPPLASDTTGYAVQTGGGDYGGLSGSGGMDGGHGGGWGGGGSAQSHYAAQAASAEPEHISGRGFYEL